MRSSVSLSTSCLQLFESIMKSKCSSSSWSCCSVWGWQACESPLKFRPILWRASRTIPAVNSCTIDLLLLTGSNVHLCNSVACCSQEAKPMGGSIFQVILSQTSTNWRWSLLIFSHVPLLTSLFLKVGYKSACHFEVAFNSALTVSDCRKMSSSPFVSLEGSHVLCLAVKNL